MPEPAEIIRPGIEQHFEAPQGTDPSVLGDQFKFTPDELKALSDTGENHADWLEWLKAVAQRREIAVLASIPASTWTAFPNFSSVNSIAHFIVKTATDEVVTDQFNYRAAGDSYEVFSLLPHTNLQIEVIGS